MVASKASEALARAGGLVTGFSCVQAEPFQVHVSFTSLPLLVPPPLGKLTELEEMFEGGQEKSRRFSKHFRAIADMYGCELFDTSTVIQSSDLDGIHLDKEAHQQLGQAVAKEVKRILK